MEHLIDKVLEALVWCDEHPDASFCCECPMWNSEHRPCSYLGERLVIDFVRKYRDIVFKKDSDTNITTQPKVDGCNGGMV